MKHFLILVAALTLVACTSEKKNSGGGPAAPAAPAQPEAQPIGPVGPGYIIPKQVVQERKMEGKDLNGGALILNDAIIGKIFVADISAVECQVEYASMVNELVSQEISRCEQSQAALNPIPNMNYPQMTQQPYMQNPQMAQQPNPQYPQNPQPAQPTTTLKVQFSFDQLGKLSVIINDGPIEYRTKEAVSYKFESVVDKDESDMLPAGERYLLIDNFTAISEGMGMGMKLKFSGLAAKTRGNIATLFRATVDESQSHVVSIKSPRLLVQSGKSKIFSIRRIFGPIELK